jgi:sigma-E factor negative regulatory protein RseB
MKLLSSLLLLLSISCSAIANEEIPAKVWLEQLSNALKKLNFSTSFVVVKNNQAQPYHWFHGIDDKGNELEIFSLLNGPRRDVLRKNNTVSYIEPELPAYSVLSTHIISPIPAVLSKDILVLESSYDFISVGRSRILGRPAQLIRIVSKDASRFGYWLWLDQKTSMLLKLAVVSRNGQQLEQIQFTHLEISEKPAESLLQLESTVLPPIVDIPKEYQQQQLMWKVNWLPEGFTQVSANRHKISVTQQPVEFMLFNDGLVDISVYVNASKEQQRTADFAMDGATVVFNQVINGIEVSVVGKIPSQTAKAIADSIQILAPEKPAP